MQRYGPGCPRWCFSGHFIRRVPGAGSPSTSALMLLSCVRLSATPWTVARPSPLSMGSPRQEHRRGLPFPPPGESSRPGDRTWVSCVGFFTSEPPGKPPLGAGFPVSRGAWMCPKTALHQVPTCGSAVCTLETSVLGIPGCFPMQSSDRDQSDHEGSGGRRRAFPGAGGCVRQQPHRPQLCQA